MKTKTFVVTVSTTSKSDIGLKVTEDMINGIIYASDTKYKCQKCVGYSINCASKEAVAALVKEGLEPVKVLDPEDYFKEN